MPIRVALNHRTSYTYDRAISIFPQILRLRPAPHTRTPIISYSLKIEPAKHFINWQQDPQGNFLARLVFPDKTQVFSVEVDLVAELQVINPFDFFLEEYAERFPFEYEPWLARELRPFLEVNETGPLLTEYAASVPRDPLRCVDFLVRLNSRLHKEISYTIRLEPGVQTAEETLSKRSGSCRDSAWLLVQVLRHVGLAARFVSGYLIQLAPDVKPLDGPAGPATDFTDLHAWTEVYLPGAGWVGLDPTSGLFADEGHIPLACTPGPQSAAAVSGGLEVAESKLDFTMTVQRVREDARVTKPYTKEQWEQIVHLGHQVDADLEKHAVRLTMGGEPTFVSIDDMEGDEWNTTAVGPNKRGLAVKLLDKLRNRYAPGGLLHYGQGKWYPGEQLPRWSLNCYWRRDGKPIWTRPELIADESRDYGHGSIEARRFGERLAQRLGVSSDFLMAAHEDAWAYMLREQRLPTNVNPLDNRIEDELERKRMAKVFDQGLKATIGFALPLERRWNGSKLVWASGPWFLRREQLFLVPGDSPMGWRLPLDSLPWVAPEDREMITSVDPLASRAELPDRSALVRAQYPWQNPYQHTNGHASNANGVAIVGDEFADLDQSTMQNDQVVTARLATTQSRLANGGEIGTGLGNVGTATAVAERTVEQKKSKIEHPWFSRLHDNRLASSAPLYAGVSAPWLVRTAMCIEARQGRLHLFMPPTQTIEDYLDLVTQIEETAAELNLPVIIEGYHPPHDYRMNHLRVTPDPGVIEVNMQPASSWDELVSITTGLYADARECRLGTDKFMLDGRHTGTGGGNHIVLGGATPAESPFLRRPDLVKSLLAYWNNHPALSYLFSGVFIGPTSQAPRIDEGRHEQLYELEIAMQQIPTGTTPPPWIVDRLFRHLLTDMTGNTHRAEFCIDKLYSPDSSTGRLGLIEFRAFEMPPHAQMSLAQQLLLRSLVSKFWREPYHGKLVHWGTSIHDKFMLPHYLWQDLATVVRDLNDAGYAMQLEWFRPHYEFRCPLYGEMTRDNVNLELRCALEPWLVLGEEASSAGTARYVDSSLERVQLKVQNYTDERYVLTCNQRRVPLFPTGTQGEFVAGVRYRAWQPPSCLHPTIGVHTPLVFDLYDRWTRRSVGGCTWHVVHPGGLSYSTYPINANEAETRRNSRFFTMNHTPGVWSEPTLAVNSKFPLTLDLRFSGS